MNLLREHYDPHPVVIAERFQFHRRNQREGESIAEFMAELRRLSTHCGFKSYLNEALRDRLVCGLRSESTQRRLLAEKDLSLQKAMEIAQGMEAADRNAKSLKGSTLAIHKVRSLPTAPKHKSPNQKPTEHSRTPCYRCGRSNHDQKDCRFRDATCHHCKKKGHIAPACRSKKNATGKATPRLTARANFVGTDALEPNEELNSEDCPIGNTFCISRLDESRSHPFTTEMELNGKTLTMEIDTGASVSIISEQLQKYSSFQKPQWSHLCSNFKPTRGRDSALLGRYKSLSVITRKKSS